MFLRKFQKTMALLLALVLCAGMLTVQVFADPAIEEDGDITIPIVPDDTVPDDDECVNHSFTNYQSNGDATCMADGTKTATCDYGCGEIDTVVDEGSKLDHKYTEYKYNNDATITKDGTETAECDYGCGTKDTRVVEGTKIKHGWLEEEGKWYFYNTGKKVPAGWFAYGKYWYYMDQDQAMQTGWLLYGGKWYFFDHNSGRMVTEKWVGDGGKWYYFDANGYMVTGWLELGNAKYYLKPDGSMATGTYTIDGKDHIFDGNGIWKGESTSAKTGWVQDGGKWYYYNKGKMVTGWFAYGPYWYFMDGNGVMKTGWLLYGGNWYYFDLVSGRMVTDTITIGDKVYNFDDSGICLNP